MEKKIREEIEKARDKYGPYNSTHELYGVLQEEVNEFWELVQAKYEITARHDQNSQKRAMIAELTQVAAVAIKGIEDLKNGDVKWV